MLSVSEASLFRINTEILHFVQNDIHMEFAFFNTLLRRNIRLTFFNQKYKI